MATGERDNTLYLAAWAATGVFTRAFSLALQRRPYFDGPHTHVLAGSLAVLIGYNVRSYRERQLTRLDAQRLRLVERRAKAEAAGGEDAHAHAH
ncbi:hypothetical protein M427DRAFT_72765 [Gonapodya prolifera JEL478]|uniref:Uncharacterized protein n=1 Tax=Gonapodya prolifera (strain JEL478) TaxID=1344416 RepID=A0A139A4W3_GONPJ|nr:hypothetical protein M427DRAFT_72765 [Gonapodya prolifera JEL478]|eukprot:KXS11668.1 hypothetical protein M427DRAFT_72765 [Gonapodya prolifera JEL478]